MANDLELEGDFGSVDVPRVTLSGLRPAARARDISVVRLICDLWEVIVADGLVGAVLDDVEAPVAKRRRRSRKEPPPAA